MNIYFIVSHPIQYFVPLYRHLASQAGVNVHVIYLSDETVLGTQDREFGVQFAWDIPLLEGYSYTFVQNRSLWPSIFNGFWGLWNPGLIKILRGLPKGLVIIPGWQYISYHLGFFWAKRLGHRTAIRCEAPFFKEIGRVRYRDRLRHFFLEKILFRKWTDVCLYIGSENLAFYRYFGVLDSRLVFSPYSIDNDRFSAPEAFDRDMLRCAMGYLPEDFIILFSGKLIPIKRPMDLIRAYEAMNWPDKGLIIVGDGELRSDLEAYVHTNNLLGVNFSGFINQRDLPSIYKLADVLVLSSESETWGLVVNEAMACGLPVIVSDAVGCSVDLVDDGVNGYIYPKGDWNALALALEKVAKTKLSGTAMGEASIEKIKSYSIRRTAEGILQAAMPAKLTG